jgi:hypothetical protein
MERINGYMRQTLGLEERQSNRIYQAACSPSWDSFHLQKPAMQPKHPIEISKALTVPNNRKANVPFILPEWTQ